MDSYLVLLNLILSQKNSPLRLKLETWQRCSLLRSTRRFLMIIVNNWRVQIKKYIRNWNRESSETVHSFYYFSFTLHSLVSVVEWMAFNFNIKQFVDKTKSFYSFALMFGLCRISKSVTAYITSLIPSTVSVQRIDSLFFFIFFGTFFCFSQFIFSFKKFVANYLIQMNGMCSIKWLTKWIWFDGGSLIFESEH